MMNMMQTAECMYDDAMMVENDTFDNDEDQHEALSKQELEYVADDYLARLPLIDAECRERMIAWFYQVVDHCHFERETVEITVNYLDRFLSNEQMIKEDTTRDDFQLIAMTCLYTAVKIHEPVAMEPATVASLSGGKITADEIEACEAHLLQGLGWRMNPPTTLSFVRLALSSSSHYKNLERSTERRVLELCNMQLEATLLEDYYSFIDVLPSTLAAAALHNSLLSLGYCDQSFLLSESMDSRVACRLARTLPHDLPTPEVPSRAPKRKSSVRYESSTGGDLSPKCVSVQP